MKKQFRAKLETVPDLQALARSFPKKFPALLNSHIVNEITGRYSILFKKSKDIRFAYSQGQLNRLFKRFDKKIPKSKKDFPLPFYSG